MKTETKIRIVFLLVLFVLVLGFVYQNWPAPAKPEPKQFLLKIYVVDKASGQPVYASIIVEAHSPEQRTRGGITPHSTQWSLVLDEGFYRIKVEASGYRPYEDIIRLDHDLTITIRLERGG